MTKLRFLSFFLLFCMVLTGVSPQAQAVDPPHLQSADAVLILHLYPDMAKRILGVAIPNSVENTLFQAAKVILGMLVATFGTSQIAANTTGQTFWSLAACMGMSMGTVFITVIGQCVGAGDTEAAEWYMRKLTRLSLVLADKR